MLKITNRGTGNKRIRLTALDSAMANIDDSTGAVAKDAKDVLICLSPMVEEIPSNEMYFTTTTGTIDYYGVIGDQIVLNDGNTITLETYSLYDITVPSGKHKLALVETRSQDYVGLGGEALVEIHNFPTLGSVNTFDTCPNNSSPNLVKVPTTLPSNITNIQYMFSGATSFNQDISMWDTSAVILMFHTFSGATAFNQDISGWNTGSVTQMYNMFENAISFNQDLSQWCVGLIPTLPSDFDTNTPSWTLPKPVWGTCPTGEAPLVVPPNDNIADAILLTGEAGTVKINNKLGTYEPGTPGLAGGSNDSVWYKWTPTISGTVDVNTLGTGWDTVLSLYTSTSDPASPGTLTEVAGNSDGGGFNGMSRLIHPVIAGTTYWIGVGGEWTSVGEITLNWTLT